MASKTRKPSPGKSLAKTIDKKKEMEAVNLSKRKKEFENEKDPKKLINYGRKWYCHFNKPIDMKQSRVQLQKMKVLLRVRKAEPRKKWLSYKFDPDENLEQDVTAVGKGSNQIGHISSATPKDKLVKQTEHTVPSTVLSEIQISDVTAAGDKTTDTAITNEQAPISNDYHGNVNEKGTEEVEQSKDVQLHAADAIIAVLYVKKICKESIQVNFTTRSLSVRFKTSDTKFLELQGNNSENISFLWKIDLVDDIVSEKSSYKVSDLQVSFTLVKVTSRKWGALEASQARDAQVSLNSAGWQKAVKTPSLANENSKTDIQVGSSDKNRTLPGTARSSILSDSNKENTSQKPTCMVSPLNKEPSLMNTLPLGMTGLDNLGNTCFLNSVVQVLANTTELRDYFLGGHFQKELNHENPLGTGGKLAVSFATLMKILWSGKYRSYAPAKLKNLVGMKNSQFMGFAQHDAQEFMAYLLDGLHEDLNRVKNKPYTSEVDSDGRPDEVVANEAWARYKSRNDSFIVDLFQGQYKSKLVCPVCKKVSITFDPFMHLSVPLPRKHKKQLHIIFMSRDPLKKPEKYVLWLPKDATADDLKELVYQKTGVPSSNLHVFESYKNKIHSLLYRGFSLTNFTPRDNIYVCEVLSEKLAGEEVYQIPCIQCTEYPVAIPTKCANCKRECEQGIKLKRCMKCMRIAYCNQTCQKQDWDRHQTNCISSHDFVGQPFIISLPKSQATFSRIAQMMEAFSRYSLDVFQPPVTPSSQVSSDIPPSPVMVSSTSSSCVDGSALVGTAASSTITQMSSSELATSDLETQPLFDSQTTSTTEVASTSSESSFVTVDSGDEPLDLTHIRYLAMIWKNNEKYQKPYVLVQSKTMDCDEDESVSTASTEESSNITLDHCLSLFTEPEVLSPDHAWYCPSCKEHREATKQLSIWRLPAYLIIQLKRFSFSSFIWRDKIDKMVEYPVRSLDLRKHFVGTLPSTEPPPIYDLYGVVNHMGGILGGHYTSYARCPDCSDWKKNEIDWRLFDDSMVSLVRDSQVMTRAGYVLFYRRRKMTVAVPSSIENLKTEEEKEIEEENKVLDANILDEQPSGLLTISNSQEPEYPGGDMMVDGNCTVPSNSPSVYSLPSTRIDMDTVD
ncbi:hypothetical protein LSH36_81g02038 [Paralvinella palmiformis]|uniref:ubiquitinyl hydrolase 1 n=1 Tax=Paralvinella palmiformis TaxID=53620 RepID=A0AAD9NAQ7_9ANNE|nr:hypothetical protein LSH36_81g02038 [Paralvinella palmiformis]